MQRIVLTSTLFATVFFSVANVVSGADRCLFPRLFPTLSSTEVPVETPRIIHPTPHVLPQSVVMERTVVMPRSESLPVRISAPIHETIRSYDIPTVASISSGVSTVVYGPYEVARPTTGILVEKYDVSRPKTMLPIENDTVIATHMVSGDLSNRPAVLVPLLSDETPENPADRRYVDRVPSQTTFEETPVRSIVADTDLEIIPLSTSTSAVSSGSSEGAKTEEDGDFQENPARSLVLRPSVVEKDEDEVDRKKPDSAFRSVTTPPPAPTILGQSSRNFANDLAEAISQPPPFPQGLVDPDAIPKELLKDPSTEGVPPPLDLGESGETKASTESESKLSKESGVANGALLIATIISIMMLIYAVVIAFDYRQRWMQTLTSQNNRYLSGWTEDGVTSGLGEEPGLYEGASYFGGGMDGIGLHRFGSELLEPKKY